MKLGRRRVNSLSFFLMFPPEYVAERKKRRKTGANKSTENQMVLLIIVQWAKYAHHVIQSQVIRDHIKIMRH